MINFLKKLFGIKPKKKGVVVDKPVETVDNSKPAYYKFLEGELGISESKDPTRVNWYHSHTSLKKADWKPSTSWCGSLMSTALSETGYKSPKTAWARTFLTVGTKLSKPIKYCTMVFERNDPGGDSHITAWTGEEDDDYYYCLGGNQGNKVCVAKYKKKDLLGAFWPEKIEKTPDLPKPQVPAGPVTFKADWDKHKDGVAWTKFTVDALRSKGKRMLAMTSFKDESKYFTKKFKDMTEDQKIQAFLTLISALVYQESKFDPKCSYVEDFDDAKGNNVVSKGLGQLSKESVNQKAYGGKIKDPNELYDPNTNLSLIVAIMDHCMQDGYIGTYVDKNNKYGAARYWSCMREISKSQAIIKAKTLAIKF